MAAMKIPWFLVALVILAVLAVRYLPSAEAEVALADLYAAGNERFTEALQLAFLLIVGRSIWKGSVGLSK